MGALLIVISKKRRLNENTRVIFKQMKSKLYRLCEAIDQAIYQQEYENINIIIYKLWFEHSRSQGIAIGTDVKMAGLCVGNPYHRLFETVAPSEFSAFMLAQIIKEKSILYEFNAPYNACIYNAVHNSFEILTDRPGLQHLYFSENDDAYFFSTSAISLACGLKAAFDYEGLLSFFMAGYVMGQKTLFDRIKKVSGGTSICISGEGKYVEKKYWIPPDEDKTITNISDVARQFSQLHRDAMRGRMAKENHVTVELTRGYDTRLNLISALKTGEPFIAWTIGEPHCAEVSMVGKLQSVMPFRHRIISLSDYKDEFYESFQNDFKLITGLTDGESNSLNLIASPISNRKSREYRNVSVSGLAGEIIRAVNYPFFKRDKSSETGIDVMRYLTFKTIRQNIGDLSVFCDKIADNVNQVMEGYVMKYFQANNNKPYHWRLDNYYFMGPSQRLVGRTVTMNNFYYRQAVPYYDNSIVDLSFMVPHNMKAYGRLFLQTFYEAGPEFANVRLANGLPARPLKLKDIICLSMFLSKTAIKIGNRFIMGKTSKRKKGMDGTGVGQFVENILLGNDYFTNTMKYDNLASGFLYLPDNYNRFLKECVENKLKYRTQIGLMMTIESLCRIINE